MIFKIPNATLKNEPALNNNTILRKADCSLLSTTFIKMSKLTLFTWSVSDPFGPDSATSSPLEFTVSNLPLMQKLHLSFGFQSMGSGGGGDNVGCGCGGDVTDNDANGDGVQVSIDFKLFPVSAVMLLELADLCDELVLEISSP